MHAGSGRPVATNTVNFSTSTDGFIHFQIDDGTGTGPIYSARVPVSQLVNNGLETLPKIAEELLDTNGMFHNRLRQVAIPTNEKIENLAAPEFSIATDGTLTLSAAYSTILTNANINPDNCQFFIYDQNDTTDHQNIPRNNVAENVGWDLDETLNINDYGYTTATASDLRVRVLAIKQNQLGVVASPTLSIENQELAGFKMYPNPTTGIVTIENKNGYEISTIEIMDKTGKEIYKLNGSQQINLENLSDGLYFIRITDKNGAYHNTKIIKE